MVLEGLAASAETFEALKPRSVTGTQTPALYSCLCTGTLGGLSGAAAGLLLACCCLLLQDECRVACVAGLVGVLQRRREKQGVLH